MDEIVFEFDEVGTYLNVWTENDALLARPKSEMLGRRIADVLDEETAEPFEQLFRTVMAQRQAESMVYELDVRKGRQWFLARVTPSFVLCSSEVFACFRARSTTQTDRAGAAQNQEEAEKANAAKTNFSPYSQNCARR